MGKPIEHAENSVKKYGGNIYDYLDIHEFMDSSQAAVPNLKHRIFTHNAWFITTVMPRIFGAFIENVDGKKVAVQSICEDHVFEDLERYPSAQDWVEHLAWQDWMKNFKNQQKLDLKEAKEDLWNEWRKRNLLPPIDSCSSKLTPAYDPAKVTVIS